MSEHQTQGLVERVVRVKIRILTEEERARFPWAWGPSGMLSQVPGEDFIVPLLRLAVRYADGSPVFEDDDSVYQQDTAAIVRLVWLIMYHNGIFLTGTPSYDFLAVSSVSAKEEERLDAAKRLEARYGKRPIYRLLWRYYERDITTELQTAAEMHGRWEGWRELEQRVLSCTYLAADEVIRLAPLFTPGGGLVKLFRRVLGREVFDDLLGKWREGDRYQSRKEADALYIARLIVEQGMQVANEVPRVEVKLDEEEENSPLVLGEEFRLYSNRDLELQLIEAIDLQTQLEHLPSIDQKIVKALQGGGNPKEVAKELGMTYGNLRVRMSRIKKIIDEKKI